MKPWPTRSLIGAAALLALVAAAAAAAAWLGERKMNRQVALPASAAAPLALSSDAATVERGRYLFLSRGCTDCHGVNGAGKVMIDDASGMHVRAPNITPAPGTVVANYTPADWARIIRHGVKPDGRAALIMASEDYARMTDVDLSAMVSYLRQMPAAPGERAEIRLPLPVKVLYGLGAIRDAAEKIDHSLPPPKPVAQAASLEHGAYLAQGCVGCHGPALAGGKIPGTPPDWPAAANLTPVPGGAMARYPDASAFGAMLRSGKRPDGSTVSAVMPFVALKEINDTDVQALYLHLKSLAPVAQR